MPVLALAPAAVAVVLSYGSTAAFILAIANAT
jgi:hypothetical protein